jgi:cyclohexa-1,5-dienecarbonyl-CoA hydratase
MPITVRYNQPQTWAAFRLSHPKGNIITAEIIDALGPAVESAAENPHLKLLTIEGEGPDFSFGASIPEHGRDQIGDVLPRMHALIFNLLELATVTAAIVRGRCLGGGFELALACDLIFAADDAVFGLPEIALGVFPPAASALLSERVGAARATRAIITGESRPADYWADAGLIELVAPTAALDARVASWFDEHLAPKSAEALRHAATAARTGLLGRVRDTLPELERLYLEDLMRTDDASEGIDAFLHKRAPRWKDR